MMADERTTAGRIVIAARAAVIVLETSCFQALIIIQTQCHIAGLARLSEINIPIRRVSVSYVGVSLCA